MIELFFMEKLVRNTLLVKVQCFMYFLQNFWREYLKGQVTPKSIIHIFPVTCSAIYPSKLFLCELPSCGDIVCRNVCLPSSIMELDDTAATAAMSFSRNQYPVTQDNTGQYRPCCELFHGGTTLFLPKNG